MAASSGERPIIVRRIRRVAKASHGGAWKVAYADFVTAMMAFFMLLWLVANPDKARLHGLAQYFSATAAVVPPSTPVEGVSNGAGGQSRRSAPDRSPVSGVPSANAATAGVARGGTANVADTSLRVMAAELQVALDAVPQDQRGRRAVDIQQDREGLRITLMDSDRQAMFRTGTADLNPYARAMLAKVAARLAQGGGQLAIEGHTDGSGGQSDANWALSGARALAARSALIAGGLTPDRFAEVVAMAATRPVFPDQPDRAENRRITIVIKAEPSALPSDASFKF
ncbi:flagellar motor protein MotB [uncultured Sphingomonas sp.]|uniref:flagellar motor protein MotB n=1 Tax=uncultured Sphingomonas sp. TaxID=158754 RepID=UPI002633ABD3|nr:flagellar motor protein MotB [uncultured Sphingomonas sp.]